MNGLIVIAIILGILLCVTWGADKYTNMKRKRKRARIDALWSYRGTVFDMCSIYLDKSELHDYNQYWPWEWEVLGDNQSAKS